MQQFMQQTNRCKTSLQVPPFNKWFQDDIREMFLVVLQSVEYILLKNDILQSVHAREWEYYARSTVEPKN